MALNQTTINNILSKTYTFGLQISPDGPLPSSNQLYNQLIAYSQNGFDVTASELLHAIGSKTAALPMSEKDECIKSAHLFLNIMDWNQSHLAFKPNLDSDLQTNRSQEIGVGLMCLIANKAFGANWDDLESIRGRGTRFDYRGVLPGSKEGVFEAKGTKYSYNQTSQINDGLRKKDHLHQNSLHYDVELIISTWVGLSNQGAGIIVADPSFSDLENAFSEEYDLFYKYRSSSRALQMAGLTKLAREYYLQAHSIVHGYDRKFRGTIDLLDDAESRLETLTINGQSYVGTWYDTWYPMDSKRYGHYRKYEYPVLDMKESFVVFQGIEKNRLVALTENRFEEIYNLDAPAVPEHALSDEGYYASIFPDLTMFAVASS